MGTSLRHLSRVPEVLKHCYQTTNVPSRTLGLRAVTLVFRREMEPHRITLYNKPPLSKNEQGPNLTSRRQRRFIYLHRPGTPQLNKAKITSPSFSRI